MPNSLSHAGTPLTVIVGGGLAGISAASALAQTGTKVLLLEARAQLGGRATSYRDSSSGETIDNCQHVSMGCCTNLRHLCRALQIDQLFQQADRLNFISPQGQSVEFAADPLPAPFHLTRAFLRIPWLSWREKFLFALGVRSLARAQPEKLSGTSFAAWLREHRQTENLVRNIWEVVLVSALSESLERIDAAYARKVFVDGFLVHPHGWRVEIPTVSLDELYSDRAKKSLVAAGVDVRWQCRVASLLVERDRVSGVVLRDGTEFVGDDFILAVPHHQIGPLLADHPSLGFLAKQAEQIESAPITSVHLWWDRPITDLPHAVFIGRLSQWVFDRGPTHLNGQECRLYQVVISASRSLDDLTPDEAIERVREELASVWPNAASATLVHGRMITERRAVFSVTPGIDRLRPPQQSPLPNLQLAGDWTQTGWPATMEGAVRSGYLAAENVLRRRGRPQCFVQPDLPIRPLACWLLKIPNSAD